MQIMYPKRSWGTHGVSIMHVDIVILHLFKLHNLHSKKVG